MSEPTFQIIQDFKDHPLYIVGDGKGTITSYHSYAFAVGMYQGLRGSLSLGIDRAVYNAWKDWENSFYTPVTTPADPARKITVIPKCDIDIYE